MKQNQQRDGIPARFGRRTGVRNGGQDAVEDTYGRDGGIRVPLSGVPLADDERDLPFRVRAVVHPTALLRVFV